MKFNSILIIILLITIPLVGCEKIGKKVENYDLFGLDQASEGMKMQQEKIKRAQEYQESLGHKRSKAYNSPNILDY